MRVPPNLCVEIDGLPVWRPCVLEVLQRDASGKPTVTHMRPELLPGEVLRERVGKIPIISGGTTMTDLIDTFRDQAVRSVIGAAPAMTAKAADPVALNSMCRRLAESTMAMELLRAKGYGRHGDSLVDMVKALPEAPRKKP